MTRSGVAQQADGAGFPRRLVPLSALDGVFQVVGHLVQIAGFQAFLNARGINLHGDAHAPGQLDRQRLRAAHAAQTSRDSDRALEAATEVLVCRARERLVGALQDALRANVDPASGGHLAVHHQARFVQTVKFLPGGPVGHQIGIGENHARGELVRPQHGHRLAGLNQQGLVVFQTVQRFHNLVESLPVARRLAAPTVDHEVLRMFGHLRIEVVHQHALGGFLNPALGGALWATGRANHGGVGLGGGHGAIVGLFLTRHVVVFRIWRKDGSNGRNDEMAGRTRSRRL